MLVPLTHQSYFDPDLSHVVSWNCGAVRDPPWTVVRTRLELTDMFTTTSTAMPGCTDQD
jgi:hypothetical protein